MIDVPNTWSNCFSLILTRIKVICVHVDFRLKNEIQWKRIEFDMIGDSFLISLRSVGIEIDRRKLSALWEWKSILLTELNVRCFMVVGQNLSTLAFFFLKRKPNSRTRQEAISYTKACPYCSQVFCDHYGRYLFFSIRSIEQKHQLNNDSHCTLVQSVDSHFCLNVLALMLVKNFIMTNSCSINILWKDIDLFQRQIIELKRSNSSCKSIFSWWKFFIEKYIFK